MNTTNLTRRTVLAATAASYARVLGANDRIQVGVIGCGNLGMRHLRLYLKPILDEGKARVAAVCDIYTEARKRAQAQARLEAKDVHHDYHALVGRADIDAVFVVTPEHWHYRMAMDALRAGKDVYLEKPMTYTIGQAREIADEVKKTGRVLQVGAQWCSDPRYSLARDVIEKGLIGNVLFAQSTYSMNSVYGTWQYRIEPEASPQTVDWPAFLGSAPKRPFSAERFFRWRKYWDYGNGVISDFYYHRLAPILVATGGRFPVQVGAHGGIYQFKDREVPDTVSMVVEYDGFHVNLASSTAGSGPERYHAPAIYGHEGTIGFFNGYLVVTPERQFRKKFEEKTGKPELRIEADPKNETLIRVNHARNFFDCMRTRKPPVLNAGLGYQVMVGIRLAADSYRQRRMMAFDPKAERVIEHAPPRPEYQGTGENYEEPA